MGWGQKKVWVFWRICWPQIYDLLFSMFRSNSDGIRQNGRYQLRDHSFFLQIDAGITSQDRIFMEFKRGGSKKSVGILMYFLLTSNSLIVDNTPPHPKSPKRYPYPEILVQWRRTWRIRLEKSVWNAKVSIIWMETTKSYVGFTKNKSVKLIFWHVTFVVTIFGHHMAS